MTALSFLSRWSSARRSVAARSLYDVIERSVMNNIECARYRRMLRAQGIEPGDLFKIR
jgi:hypothetical protein